jgi:hypothetical protein
MINKHEYLEQLLKIKDRVPLSIYEMAKQLDLTYNGLKKILDVDDVTEIRESTVRKIKTLINLYRDVL